MASFVLVHSPLVGPVTWSWVAEQLERRGHHAVLPGAGHGGVSRWEDFVQAVVQWIQLGESAVLVGHSGAGPLLPVIADRMLPPASQLVFVDAGVPPVAGDAALVPNQFLGALRALARDGVLPKWSEWFREGAMEALVPDDARRAAVMTELPELPLSYFDGVVPMPSKWSTMAGAYILLSDPYRPDAAAAAGRGWPVIELLGGHLDIVTRPGEVASAILDVVGL